MIDGVLSDRPNHSPEGSPAGVRSQEADYHKVRFAYDPRRAVLWNALARYLQTWVDAEAPLLELGAGYGEFTRAIQASKKYALDLNTDLVEYWDPSVEPIVQSALEPWNLPDASLGTVFASNFFEHFTIDDGARILEQAKRALKPGGRLICVQPNFRLEPRRYFDDYTHKAIYTDNGFADFVTAMGFRILHAEPRFTPFTMKSRLPVAEWLINLYLRLPYRPLAGQFLIVAER